MCFTTFEKQKKAFLEYKIKKLKTRKMGIYPMDAFGQILDIFPFFYFLPKRPGECVLQCSKKKKHLPRRQKQEVHKVEKLVFSQRG